MLKVRKVGEEIFISIFQINKINTLFSDILMEQLKALVEVPGNNIFFDLSQIKFIDSSGFEMLKKINAISKSSASKFVLCNISSEVKELFNLMSLNGILETCNKDLALESLVLEVE